MEPSRSIPEHLQVLDKRAAAQILGISLIQLDKLTKAGALGHVNIGLGTKRAHVGYLRRHLDEFLRSREVAPR